MLHLNTRTLWFEQTIHWHLSSATSGGCTRSSTNDAMLIRVINMYTLISHNMKITRI